MTRQLLEACSLKTLEAIRTDLMTMIDCRYKPIDVVAFERTIAEINILIAEKR